MENHLKKRKVKFSPKNSIFEQFDVMYRVKYEKNWHISWKATWNYRTFFGMSARRSQKDGAKYDIDYPHILIYSLPTPFYVDREIDSTAMQSALTVGIEGCCVAA